MSQAIDNLSPDSLGWAFAHVKRFGDTDIFPEPFEFDSIGESWPEVQAYLSSIDLSKHSFRSPMRALSAKHANGFRVVVQLDPYDSLLYLAIAREVGALVESLRIPEERGIACSYRVEFSPDGQLFKKAGGWDQFQETSRARCREPKVKFVLTADISDFYNQIYHH